MTDATRDEPEADPAAVARLFDDLVDRPPDERAARLEATEAALKSDVESLLRAHDAAGRFLVEPAPLGEAAGAVGERVGAWRLVAELGRGGMGTVWLAERADGAFEQRAALKRIRGGFVSESLAQRFLLERRMLARLSHPNIARLLDGGLDESGSPFLVLEQVRGTPIDLHCDARRLPVAARLALFEQVCDAVRHAHAQLVVHRDLKPSNIYVDDEGRVKLLDFGVAKLLADEGGGAPSPTVGGLPPFTPGYASPEQLAGGVATTATDVYSLGVVLWELLAGERPPSDERTGIASTSGRTVSAETAAARATTPRALRRALAGDLGAVVARALERDPAERYPSVEALAEDLGRAAHREPVRARPASLTRRMRLFGARHRLALASATAAFAALLAGLVAFAWQARVAARERDAARRETARAEEVERFLVGLFEEADPAEAKGEEITARELLDRGAARIDGELAGQPEAQAELLHALVKVHVSLGLYDRARELSLRELAILGELATADGPRVARALNLLGNVEIHLGEIPAAIARLSEALRIRRERLGPDSAEVAQTLNDLAIAHFENGDLALADREYRESLRIQRAVLGPDDPETATTASNLSGLVAVRGDLAEAELLARDALRVFRARYGEDHLLVAATLGDLARVKVRQKDFAAAEALEREGLAIQLRLLGPDHPDVSTRRNNLASVLLRSERFAEAEAEFKIVLASDSKSLGDDHPYIAITLDNLAASLVEQGRAEEALPLLERALEMHRRLAGPGHSRVATSLRRQAEALLALGRPGEATPLVEEAIRILESQPEVVAADLETARALRARIPAATATR